MVAAIYYAPKVSRLVRINLHGSSIVGKSHPPSVLCLDATTTTGPYPECFELENELLAPKLLELMFCK